MPHFMLFFILFLLVSMSSATPLSKINTPEPLKPWVDWVLQDQENYRCPFFYNNFQQKRCNWPGKLHLDLHTTHAQFSSHWRVFSENWITLPGNRKYWPQNVTINKKPAPVMEHHGKPRIKLAPGWYDIRGEFFWDRIPDNLTIPKDTGLLSLTINNKNIPFPALKQDTVWLKESDIDQKKPKSVENKLDLQIFRKIDDNIPLQVMTFLELEVAGDQREIILPHALLTGFIPINLNSPLPARIEADGSLRIQVRQGRWHIELNARHLDPVNRLNFKVSDPQWPASEIWSFYAQPFQRVVEIQNLKAIDPSQTNIPKDWKALPAYLVKQGDSMVFKVIRRGKSEAEPNQLKLNRQFWLDFNGDAYTVTDTITGKMTAGWRLNTLPETQLGQVKLNGENQLVTHSSEADKKGVEVRKGKINLVANSRIYSAIADINAVGWEYAFNHVQAELNLPPGWRLLIAGGVDNDPDSWISQWTLLDLFLVLIASLAISRLWTVVWGVIALITLIICWHEAEAPHYIWLHILSAIALIRVLPTGKFQSVLKWYRNGCWLVLLVMIIPFMITQVRIGLYPQLEKPWQRTYPALFNMDEPPIAMKVAQKEMRKEMSDLRMHGMSSQPHMNLLEAMPKRRAEKHLVERIDPDANVQTGPSLPQWQWKKIRLSWNGSVDQHQRISLWYITPMVNLLLNIARVLLIAVLSLLIFGLLDKKFKFVLPQFSWIIVISLLGLPVQDVSANFPEQTLLDELKSRLLKAPDCLPVCAQIPKMDIMINQQQLRITLQLHVQQTVATPLPSKQGQWLPNSVLVNNNPRQALINNKGTLWISLEPGIHQIELVGLIPAHHKFTLPLPLKPHRTTLAQKGWQVEGLHEHGRTDNQLIFNRLKTVLPISKGKAHQQKIEPSMLPAFIKIDRTLSLGLDWRINTLVSRVLNNDSAVTLKFPLLKGESVISPNIRVKNKQVQINLSPQLNSFQWESVLEKSEQIDLIAADTDLWTEIWRVDVSPTWHVETDGIAVVHHQDRGRWLPEWRPWPGEKVSLIITRPQAVKGATLAIDQSTLEIKPGKRSIENTLTFVVRSSKGTQHKLQLPEQVELQTVMINGITQPIRQKGTEVSLPIIPGRQTISLNWRKQMNQSSVLTTPRINMGLASVNNSIKVLLGRDRWVLLTSGPQFGPAVLFWGVLVVLLFLSIGLGKVSLTPLKHWHWFLLLIGLSQIPSILALVVVAWLIALGIRANKQITSIANFNAIQVGLGLLTLISLLVLFNAVQQGLIASPDMQIVGNHSSPFDLNWYQDQNHAILPSATVISVPLMGYRLLMLLWSLWLAIALLNWLKWGWSCFSTDGLWKTANSKAKNTPLISDSKQKQ